MLRTINTPDLQGEAVPVLTAAQIDRIRPCAKVRSVQAGEVLFEPGNVGKSLFVVLSGRLDIALLGLSGERVFATYGPGQFSPSTSRIRGNLLTPFAALTRGIGRTGSISAQCQGKDASVPHSR